MFSRIFKKTRSHFSVITYWQMILEMHTLTIVKITSYRNLHVVIRIQKQWLPLSFLMMKAFIPKQLSDDIHFAFGDSLLFPGVCIILFCL